MNEQLLLDKWHNLNLDEQKKVLNFIDSIFQGKSQEKVYQPKTELGKKLWAIRQKAIANNPNIKLLELDEINAELDEMRRKVND